MFTRTLYGKLRGYSQLLQPDCFALPGSVTKHAPPADFRSIDDEVSVLLQISVKPAASESSVGGMCA
jgi:hypothetical protein